MKMKKNETKKPAAFYGRRLDYKLYHWMRLIGTGFVTKCGLEVVTDCAIYISAVA